MPTPKWFYLVIAASAIASLACESDRKKLIRLESRVDMACSAFNAGIPPGTRVSSWVAKYTGAKSKIAPPPPTAVDSLAFMEPLRLDCELARRDLSLFMVGAEQTPLRDNNGITFTESERKTNVPADTRGLQLVERLREAVLDKAKDDSIRCARGERGSCVFNFGLPKEKSK